MREFRMYLAGINQGDLRLRRQPTALRSHRLPLFTTIPDLIRGLDRLGASFFEVSGQARDGREYERPLSPKT